MLPTVKNDIEEHYRAMNKEYFSKSGADELLKKIVRHLALEQPKNPSLSILSFVNSNFSDEIIPPILPTKIQEDVNIDATIDAIFEQPKFECDTAVKEGLDPEEMRSLLFPTPKCVDGSDPRYLKFSISVNHAAFKGWVKQPSPCCCASASAGAWNTSLYLLRPNIEIKGKKFIASEYGKAASTLCEIPAVQATSHHDTLSILRDLLGRRIKKKVQRFLRLMGTTTEILCFNETQTISDVSIPTGTEQLDMSKYFYETSKLPVSFLDAEHSIYLDLHPLVMSLRQQYPGVIDIDPEAPKYHPLSKDDIAAGLTRGKKIKGASRKKIYRLIVNIVQNEIKQRALSNTNNSVADIQKEIKQRTLSNTNNSVADIHFEDNTIQKQNGERDCFSRIHELLMEDELVCSENDSNDIIDGTPRDCANESTSSDNQSDVDDCTSNVQIDNKRKSKISSKKWKWKTDLVTILKSSLGYWKVSEDANPRPSTAAFGNWGVLECIKEMNGTSGGSNVTVKLLMGAIHGNKKSSKKLKKVSSINDKTVCLKAEFSRSGTALIGHWKNHYAMIFAMREWEEFSRDNTSHDDVTKASKTTIFHRELLTARKGQRPRHWISFEEVHSMMCRWSGHKIMIIEAIK
eukprot:GSMAST32.ASY1.ANO1.700.1 assembled CDS